MENNFTIDFAKTLFMPTRPDHVDEKIKDYIKNKVPTSSSTQRIKKNIALSLLMKAQ